MNNIMFSFIVTALAGFSTMIGILPIYFKKADENKIIPCCLSFSSGVMLTISLGSLIPEGSELLRDYFYFFPAFLISFILIVIGIIFSSVIDKKIDEKINNNNLFKLGVISIIVLILHNIPEGITTFLSTSSNIALGLTLSLAIALHNIPEGISIAIPIYYSTGSKIKACFFTFISGFSEVLGAILAYLFLARYINNFILGIILLITAGIMFHISIYELLPTSFSYKKKRLSLISFLTGVFIMIICQVLF